MLDHESIRGLRARTQALAGTVREASAAAVVRRVFAIQAQDAMAAGLGIRVSGRDVTAAGIRSAYEDERSIVRGWRRGLHVRDEDIGHDFAGCTSSTPLDASSGTNVRHRLDTGGNRALNSVSTRS
ncbi:hypothetical protein ACFVH7_38925 [Kitasatospora indigofera]|uniref:hypothetical protein n=1 Tax=Kitasatospora indigofera TaxID=67307 RepID=UPI003640696F